MAKRRHTRKYPPYGTLSARRRRDAFVRLRWKVIRDTPLYGGSFTSHQILDEPGRPELFSHWFDFVFPGEDGRTIWNAEIITATRDLWDEVGSIAWDRATALMTEGEQEEEFRLDFEPVMHGGQKFYRQRSREPRRYPAFGNLTFRDYKDQLMARIIVEEPPAIHESFQADHSFRYGVGLKMIVDAPFIDRPVVERAIERFRAGGEADWTSPDPVPRDRLPVQTEAEALEAHRPSTAT